jgi:hypothetical protein
LERHQGTRRPGSIEQIDGRERGHVIPGHHLCGSEPVFSIVRLKIISHTRAAGARRLTPVPSSPFASRETPRPIRRKNTSQPSPPENCPFRFTAGADNQPALPLLPPDTPPPRPLPPPLRSDQVRPPVLASRPDPNYSCAAATTSTNSLPPLRPLCWTAATSCPSSPAGV